MDPCRFIDKSWLVQVSLTNKSKFKLCGKIDIVDIKGAGMCQIIITTPMELFKIALQDSGRISQTNSLNFHVASCTRNNRQ